ncbi:MAG TPA: hypothetical protein VFT19_13905 [Solirubrobacterales bacterium]|nr:hypothetical protein [Solirubrobacterales bacterium]
MRALLARLCSEERGITIVEGVVAALLLTLGALSALQVFDAGARNTFRAEQSQTINNRLQAELEQIRRLPYEDIALTGQPAHSVNPNDPRWRVQGTRYAVGRNGGNLKELVYEGGAKPDGGTVESGEVESEPEPFAIGDISGEIYRFVVWTGDPSCPECGAGLVKRVIVSALLDETGITGDRAFQEIHSEIVDPEATLDDNPPPFEEEVDAGTSQLWLTDTPCQYPTKQAIAGDHDTHNTEGRCAEGLRTGTEPGAPDLLYGEAPKLDPELPSDEQPVYDYATDVGPVEPLEDEIGLAMLWPSSGNCQVGSVLGIGNARKLLDGKLEPLAEEPGELDGLLDQVEPDADAHVRRHVWVSPPVAGEGGTLLGKGTLELYSQTVNSAVHGGEVCVSLFVRYELDVPVCTETACPATVEREVDVPVVNNGETTNLEGLFCPAGEGQPYVRCSQTSWPTEWERVAVPLTFTDVDSEGKEVPLELSPGSRIGVAVTVRKSGTAPADGLEFMYDAVGYESRLELETDHIIPFG